MPVRWAIRPWILVLLYPFTFSTLSIICCWRSIQYKWFPSTVSPMGWRMLESSRVTRLAPETKKKNRRLVLHQLTSKLFLKQHHKATSQLKPNQMKPWRQWATRSLASSVYAAQGSAQVKFSLISGKCYQVPCPEGKQMQDETQLIPAQPGWSASHAQPHTDISAMCNCERSQKLTQTQLLDQKFYSALAHGAVHFFRNL